MSLTAAPSTPATPAPLTPQLHTPSGTWKHPKFDEITRRQYATTFDDRNVRILVANGALLAASFFAHAVADSVKLLAILTSPLHSPYSAWALVALRLFFALNMATALLPLVRRYYPDDIADIPLTPSQRSSMGLPAASATTSAAVPSPASAYVTPPRYSRSTPRSSFSSHSDRPQLSASPSASLNRSTGYSPGFSSANKRASYGPSPYSSLFGESSSSATPGTPTPATGRASVSLNNKWLYEKRRDSPRSAMFA